MVLVPSIGYNVGMTMASAVSTEDKEMSIAPNNLLHPGTFLWASGIENTFVPQVRPGDRALDEYELMGHYQHWREDLALARDLGLHALRWGIPWYRVEPKQGQFD